MPGHDVRADIRRAYEQMRAAVLTPPHVIWDEYVPRHRHEYVRQFDAYLADRPFQHKPRHRAWQVGDRVHDPARGYGQILAIEPRAKVPYRDGIVVTVEYEHADVSYWYTGADAQLTLLRED